MARKKKQKQDEAHDETDRIIEETERKIHKEYAKAEKELKQKVEAFFEKFDTEDEEKRQQLANGEITADYYRKWRTTRMATGQRWKDMRQIIAEDMANANDLARSTINGHAADVYALNRNFATYQVEKEARINTSFTLYNRRAVENLMNNDKRLLPLPTEGSRAWQAMMNKDLRWNQQKINSSLIQGILQGDSIPELSERLLSIVGNNEVSARRSARTMMTFVENKARDDSYEELKSKGVELETIWLATLDDRTRHSHRQLHGEARGENGRYSNGLRFPADPSGAPEEVYNCFVGETKIATDSEVIRSYKHKYNGQIVSIKTAGGVNFSCTPNHPILTLSGWKPAESLHNGDDVLIAVVTDSVNSRRNPDVNHVFPRLDTIHDFSDVLGCERTGALGVNFHGDIATSEVEVIAHKGLLRDDRNAFGSKAFDKLILKLADKSFVSKSSFMKHFWSVFGVTLRNVRFFCKSYPFFLWRVCHPNIHCLRPISWNDITHLKDTIYRGSAVSGFLSESLNRRPCKVFVDNVVDVGISEKELHVYNLQTLSGYYFANENIDESCNIGMFIIAHNCRCCEISHVKGYPIDIPKWSPKMGDMTFEEWLGEHEESAPKSIKEPQTARNRFGKEIVFDEVFSSEKWGGTKELISALADEYDTKLETVKVGAHKAAGEVQISGSVMSLSTKEKTAILHEFAHTLSLEKQTKFGLYDESDFWKEIKKIQRLYRKDVGSDTHRWISTYEHSNRSADEFLAEAFAYAKAKELGIELPSKYGEDSKYANMVLEVINKYFKRKR